MQTAFACTPSSTLLTRSVTVALIPRAMLNMFVEAEDVRCGDGHRTAQLPSVLLMVCTNWGDENTNRMGDPFAAVFCTCALYASPTSVGALE